MKPLRILELIASSQGGGASHVFDLATRLDRTRFDVQVMMPEDGGNVRREDFAAAGIPFRAVSIAGSFSLSGLSAVRQRLAEVDILHVHGARAALTGRLAAMMLGRNRPRILYTIHGFAIPYYPAPKRQVLLGIERTLAPLVDRFIAVAHAEKAAVVEAGVAPAERVSVVWNGIDVPRFQVSGVDAKAVRAELGVPPETVLITTACRLHRPRDFDTLLRAMRRVVDQLPQAHLLVIGDGPMRGEIEAQIAALQLQQSVTLAGWRRNMPPIYASSDLFVLTTWGWEGLPLSIAEAMAAGLPVVTSDAGGSPEIVVEGETGFVVAQRNVDALAKALVAFAGDSQLRQRAGLAGKQRVESTFTLPIMVRNTAAVYELVMAQSSKGAGG